MSFTKITAEDTANKGVVGLADTPNLSTQEMQEKFDELATDVIIPKFNALSDELDAKDYDTLIAERVVSADITNIRLNADNQLETSLDGGETWETSASSGHIIENGAGTMFPSRARMQFSDNVTVVDKPTDNKTFISIPAGEKGDKGESATIRVGTVASGTEVKIENVGSDTDAIFNFEIPKGDNGSAATIRVGSVQSGTNASVYNSGTTSDAVFNFVLPKGDKGDTGTSFQILGMYATYADLIAAHPTGQRGAAYAVGTSDSNVIYNWNTDASTWDNLGSLQGAKGDTGNAATVTVGTVTTGATSNVENVGTSENAVFNFTLEKGAKGDTGSAATIAIGTVTNGDYPSVTNVGTDTNAIFDIVLQRGEQGAQGTPTTVNGKTAANIELDTRDMLMTGYVKSAEGDIATTDTLAVALSKLETRKSGGSIISVTVDDELVGENITCENGSETYTKVATSTTEFNVESVGEWTITCGENSTTVEITYFGIYDCEIHARGQYNYEGWLESASISETFSSLEEVLADEKTLRILMTKHDSADYLSEWCESDEEVAEQILGTDLVAKWVNLRDYCLDKLYSVASVKAIMDTIGKYGFGEWVLKNQVPNMTSATQPSGEVVASTPHSTLYGYNAFDGKGNSTFYLPANGTTCENYTLGYKFPSAKKITNVRITCNNSHTYTIHVYGHNGNTKTELGSLEVQTYGDVWTDYNIPITNTNEYSYYSIGLSGQTYAFNSGYIFCVSSLEFYLYEPKGLVPTMTSNSAPYGECSGSSKASSSYDYYKAFNGTNIDGGDCWAMYSKSGNLGYKFTNPTCVKRFMIENRNASGDVHSPSVFKLQGSNDGNYEDIQSYTNSNNTQSAKIYFDVDNDDYYLYYRLLIENANGTDGQTEIANLQFFGRTLSVSVPKMESNTSPWGECSGSSFYDSSFSAYDGFNPSGTKQFNSAMQTNQWLKYKFDNSVLVKIAKFKFSDGASGNTSVSVVIQGSNDNENWNTISDTITTTSNVESAYILNNDTSYQYYRIYQTNGSKGIAIWHANFYALDYSEHTERHYIYDNGVEVEEVSAINSSGILEKQSNQLYGKAVNVSGACNFKTSSAIDLTSYNLVRAILGNKVYTSDSSVSPSNLSVSTPSGTEKAYKLNDITRPYEQYLDIASVNEQCNISYGITSSSRTFEFSITSWWLE